MFPKQNFQKCTKQLPQPYREHQNTSKILQRKTTETTATTCNQKARALHASATSRPRDGRVVLQR